MEKIKIPGPPLPEIQLGQPEVFRQNKAKAPKHTAAVTTEDGSVPEIQEPCSYYSCPSEHRWPIKFRLVGCPGCQAGIISVKMDLCPFCNEPPINAHYRIDISTEQIGHVPACLGIKNDAQQTLITIPVEDFSKESVLGQGVADTK